MFECGDDRIAAVGVLMVVLGVVAASGVVAGAVPATPAGATLTVDDDGGADYRTIGAALAAAEGGDRVVVRPGTYEESVTIRNDVELVAPAGATLSGSTLGDATAITIDAGLPAAPTVSGLTIAGYDTGVSAVGTGVDWTLADLRVRNVSMAVDASRTTGNWTVRDVRVRGASYGLYSAGSSGDWTVDGITVADGSSGVFAGAATGEWTVRDSTFSDLSSVGVYADTDAGRWSVRNSTFEATPFGVYAPEAAGDWSVVDSTFRDGRIAVFAAEAPDDWLVEGVTVEDHAGAAVHAAGATGNWHVVESRIENVTPAPGADYDWDGVAVYAPNATGEWAVDGNAIVDAARYGVVATGDGDGDATRNWWPGLAPADRCVGDVDCSYPLSVPPGTRDDPDLRRDAPEEVVPGESYRVELTVEFDDPRERVAVFDAYRGPIASASIESVSIGDERPGDRLVIRDADEDDLRVGLTDVPANEAVTVVYNLTVSETASLVDTVAFTGTTYVPDVTAGDRTGDFGFDRAPVVRTDVRILDPPYGEVTDDVLENAIVDWSSGEISDATLREVIVEWSRDSG